MTWEACEPTKCEYEAQDAMATVLVCRKCGQAAVPGAVEQAEDDK